MTKIEEYRQAAEALKACEDAWHKFEKECDVKWNDDRRCQELRGVWAYDIFSQGFNEGRITVPALCDALDVAREELRIVHEEYGGRDCIELHDSLAVGALKDAGQVLAVHAERHAELVEARECGGPLADVVLDAPGEDKRPVARARRAFRDQRHEVVEKLVQCDE